MLPWDSLDDAEKALLTNNQVQKDTLDGLAALERGEGVSSLSPGVDTWLKMAKGQPALRPKYEKVKRDQDDARGRPVLPSIREPSDGAFGWPGRAAHVELIH